MEREAIQDIAIKTLIINNGASMHDIAVAAGIGRTTLHRYFASREDMLRALLLAAFQDIEQALVDCHIESGSASEALERVITAFVPIGHRFTFLLGAWPLADDDKELKSRELRLLYQFESLVQRGQKEKILRTDLSVRWIIDTMTALLFMAWQRISDGYIAPRDATKLVMTTLVAGVGIH
ncbi:hypothetical protein KDA_62880 [Dictyobacter alpinus]|uniref:HTH tetR-type domain-containing protein n=1 Tax=Dictyobacter alpinus TaxID=2014873 RepID=A0A402BHB0_9CHLR|nr:TetR/AcrR family transcriptional regulator [Dictyobacter alpinus]GCE30804.1 hypothetical protein KDA_62880 [Dictyobacter alpinus]